MTIKDLIKELLDAKKWYSSICYNSDKILNQIVHVDEIIEILRQHEEMLSAVDNVADTLDELLDLTWKEPEIYEHRKITTKKTK